MVTRAYALSRVRYPWPVLFVFTLLPGCAKPSTPASVPIPGEIQSILITLYNDHGLLVVILLWPRIRQAFRALPFGLHSKCIEECLDNGGVSPQAKSVRQSLVSRCYAKPLNIPNPNKSHRRRLPIPLLSSAYHHFEPDRFLYLERKSKLLMNLDLKCALLEPCSPKIG